MDFLVENSILSPAGSIVPAIYEWEHVLQYAIHTSNRGFSPNPGRVSHLDLGRESIRRTGGRDPGVSFGAAWNALRNLLSEVEQIEYVLP